MSLMSCNCQCCQKHKKQIEELWKIILTPANPVDLSPHKQKADELGVPCIPPLPEKTPHYSDTVAVCGQCGLEIKQVMGYVCNNSRCPVFPKATC